MKWKIGKHVISHLKECAFGLQISERMFFELESVFVLGLGGGLLSSNFLKIKFLWSRRSTTDGYYLFIITEKWGLKFLCLLFIDKARVKGNTYIWVSLQWETRRDIYMSRIHWVVWGTGTPKDSDEGKRQEIWECEGWVYDLEAIGVSSMFRLILSATSLVRRCPTFDLKCEENTERRKWKFDCVIWTPEVEKKRSEITKFGYTQSSCTV